MDLPQLQDVLARIHRGAVTCVSRDTPEPSVFSHDIINARPHAPSLTMRRKSAERRRCRLGVPATRVTISVPWISPPSIVFATRFAPIHAMRTNSTMCCSQPGSSSTRKPIPRCARHSLTSVVSHVLDVSIPRRVSSRPFGLPPNVFPKFVPSIRPPCSSRLSFHRRLERRARGLERDALVELVRGRMSIVGPTDADAIAESIRVAREDVDGALLTLESEGAVLRGTFTTGSRGLEWCDRRLLARIHRYTLNRLRAEIASVSPAEFMRFLFAWQHVEQSSRLSGPEGLRALLAQLDGVELPARAWERDVLPARLERYETSMLDMLCLSGEVGWARLSSGPTQVVGATPIALFLREHAEDWWALRRHDPVGDFLSSPPEITPGSFLNPLAASSITCRVMAPRSYRT